MVFFMLNLMFNGQEDSEKMTEIWLHLYSLAYLSMIMLYGSSQCSYSNMYILMEIAIGLNCLVVKGYNSKKKMGKY